MAVASGRVSLVGLLRNWGIVYVGNFVGAVATAGIMLLDRTIHLRQRGDRGQRPVYRELQDASWASCRQLPWA